MRARRWLPEISHTGYFQEIGGLLIAVYRDPAAPDDLWLQLDGTRWLLTSHIASTFSPDIANEDPALENADLVRTLQLIVDGTIRFAHTYALRDREKRLYYGMDPFPNWPDEEENYDLLYFVHRILASGR